MLGAIFGFLLKLAGSGVVDKTLGYLERKADNETERQRIAADREKARDATHAGVITAAMGHRMFWVAWSIAAIPTTVWYGWGMLDTAMNGALPDVATIPPGLQPWAQTVWNNIFFTGAGVAGINGAASIVAKAIERRR